MIVYVVRHAEAIERSAALQDEWRYLTEKGRNATEKIAAAIVKLGPKPRLTITSPLTRAVQTAEIAATKACRKNVIMASHLLLPNADVSELATHVRECRDAKRLMLVGHEPQLGALVVALMGRPDVDILLKKGSCVALEIDEDRQEKPATFLWYLTPGKKRNTSFKRSFPQNVPL